MTTGKEQVGATVCYKRHEDLLGGLGMNLCERQGGRGEGKAGKGWERHGH